MLGAAGPSDGGTWVRWSPALPALGTPNCLAGGSPQPHSTACALCPALPCPHHRWQHEACQHLPLTPATAEQHPERAGSATRLGGFTAWPQWHPGGCALPVSIPVGFQDHKQCPGKHSSMARLEELCQVGKEKPQPGGVAGQPLSSSCPARRGDAQGRGWLAQLRLRPPHRRGCHGLGYRI